MRRWYGHKPIEYGLQIQTTPSNEQRAHMAPCEVVKHGPGRSGKLCSTRGLMGGEEIKEMMAYNGLLCHRRFRCTYIHSAIELT
jgi:hypothetical protein